MSTLFPPDLVTRAEALLARCRADGLTLATAESCTGGLITGLVTEIAGSSDVVERGFVTYSNQAKHDLLGVPLTILYQQGAVSEACARAMAEGVLRKAPVALAVAVTGIAGPGGGSPEKPVGLVHFAACRRGREGTVHARHVFAGGRTAIRLASVAVALDLLDGLI